MNRTSEFLPLEPPVLDTGAQGCIRPRLSPFWRPSTSYNGVSDPMRGGVSIAGFRAKGGGSIAGFWIFGREAPEKAPKAPF